MTPTDRDSLREMLAQIIWNEMDGYCTEPCFSHANRDTLGGCGCINDAAAAVLSALDAAGLRVMPPIPTAEIANASPISLGLPCREFVDAYQAWCAASPFAPQATETETQP